MEITDAFLQWRKHIKIPEFQFYAVISSYSAEHTTKQTVKEVIFQL